MVFHVGIFFSVQGLLSSLSTLPFYKWRGWQMSNQSCSVATSLVHIERFIIADMPGGIFTVEVLELAVGSFFARPLYFETIREFQLQLLWYRKWIRGTIWIRKSFFVTVNISKKQIQRFGQQKKFSKNVQSVLKAQKTQWSCMCLRFE